MSLSFTRTGTALACALVIASMLAPVLAMPAAAQSNSLVGTWRCVQNSVVVSVDVMYQLFPDGSAAGQGSITYVQTHRHYPFQNAPGRWSVGPNSVVMQLFPPNHASFSIEVGPAPNGDPNFLYYNQPNLASGGMTETTCQRLG